MKECAVQVLIKGTVLYTPRQQFGILMRYFKAGPSGVELSQPKAGPWKHPVSPAASQGELGEVSLSGRHGHGG